MSQNTSHSQEIIHLINRAREEARKDSIKSFLLKNKAFVIALILLVLFLIIVLALSSNSSLSRKEEFSEKFYQILNAQNIDSKEYETQLRDLIKDEKTPQGIKSLAQMRLASDLLEKNRMNDALKIYKEINNDQSYDEYLRDLSGLLAAQILANSSSVDQKTLTNELSHIESKAKTFKFHIMELRAVLEFKNNNFSKAAEIFDTIAKAPESPAEIKNRAKQMAIVAAEKSKS